MSPKLVTEQFDSEGKAKTRAFFLGRRIIVTYHNPAGLNYDEYKISRVSINEKPIDFDNTDDRVKILKHDLEQSLCIQKTNFIDVDLE